jgi:hypothetical protein
LFSLCFRYYTQTFFVTRLIINKINKVQWVDFKLENVLVLRNGELLWHSPMRNVYLSIFNIRKINFICCYNLVVRHVILSSIIWDEVPTMVEIAIFWFQIHITNGQIFMHRKWRTGNQYMVKSAENRMRSNLELLNVKKWLKIAVCSSPLNFYSLML